MKGMLSAMGAVALGAVFVAPASANLLTNGSLETAVTPDRYGLITASPSVNSSALPGWTITSGTIDIVPNAYWQSATGGFSVDMIGSPNVGVIAQSVETAIGETYTLTFDLSANPENLTGEAHFDKPLTINALSSASALDATQNYTASVGSRTRTNMQYTGRSFQFTASSTLTTLLIFASAPTGASGNLFCGPVIDNLDLESNATAQPLPEPASLALLSVGGLLLLRRRPRSASR